MDEVVLVAGDAEEVRELVDYQPYRGILADAFGVYAFIVPYLAEASAIDNATPLGLQAPGLMITSASRKRLPWGRFASDMSNISVEERGYS
jgi:hypothetical protein